MPGLLATFPPGVGCQSEEDGRHNYEALNGDTEPGNLPSSQAVSSTALVGARSNAFYVCPTEHAIYPTSSVLAQQAILTRHADPAILHVRLHREDLMSDPATTKLSSKGQVVIPEEIRNRLGLKPGARFVVLGEGDVVILKVIHSPDMAEFDDLVGRARKAAEEAGLTEADVNEAIKQVRRRSA